MTFAKKGFTLIELLVVIGVLAVLMAGVVALINPQDKLRAANDAKVQSDIAEMATASQAYAATHDGYYPANTGNLTTSGDLVSVPTAPSGYAAYVFTSLPAGCTAGTTCTGVNISGTLQSSKYTGRANWQFMSSEGKTCAKATLGTACP
jgi:prepilin-type N-terminal cleavage/methylation domain-containing protein